MPVDVTEIQREIHRLERDRLRNAFLTHWKQLGGPELELEFKFDSVRDWKFDLYYRPARLCIDLQGGNWKGGAHVRPARYSKDCAKHNAAILAGFRVLWFTTDMIANDPAGHLQPIIELIRREDCLRESRLK